MFNDSINNGVFHYKDKLDDLVHMMQSQNVIEGSNLIVMTDVLTEIARNNDVDSLNLLSNNYHNYINFTYKGYISDNQLYSKAHNNLLFLSHLADYRNKANSLKKNSIDYLVNVLKKDEKIGNIKKGLVYDFVIKELS